MLGGKQDSERQREVQWGDIWSWSMGWRAGECVIAQGMLTALDGASGTWSPIQQDPGRWGADACWGPSLEDAVCCAKQSGFISWAMQCHSGVWGGK